MERTALALTSGNEADAKDLVQTTLVELFVRWRRIRDPQARDAYSRTVMVRAALRAQRSGGVTDPWPEDDATGTPATVDDVDVSQVAATAVDLDRYLRLLSPRQRAVVVCRYLCDLTEEETARVLRCATGTVKAHHARALRHLRRALDDSNHLREPRR